MITPRLVATDLDGTLLRPDGSVSERTAAALAACEAVGVGVVFVTARPPRWLVGLSSYVGGHGIAICANGAAVIDVACLSVIEQSGMTRDEVAELTARIRLVDPGSHFAVERAEGFAAETGFLSRHPVPVGSPSAGRVEEVLGGSTFKLLVQSDAPGSLDDFVLRLAAAVGDRAVVSHSGADGLAEIAARGVTKASTLARWAASQRIRPHDVWAIGDAPNDLPMLAWAGTAFAVANAHPALLAAADRVLPSNAEDGVATLLEEVVQSSRGGPH